MVKVYSSRQGRYKLVHDRCPSVRGYPPRIRYELGCKFCTVCRLQFEEKATRCIECGKMLRTASRTSKTRDKPRI